MSGQASPMEIRSRGKHAPTAGIVLAVLVALLILFQWLHFILAQRIESAGREIQVKTEELHRIERQNQELQRQISIAGSEETMAERSRSMGYAAQRPVYLLVDQPLPPASQNPQPMGQELTGATDGARAAFGWPASVPGAGGHSGD